jgi:hypothetical protein
MAYTSLSDPHASAYGSANSTIIAGKLPLALTAALPTEIKWRTEATVFLKVPMSRFYVPQGSGHVNHMRRPIVLLESDFFPRT